MTNPFLPQQPAQPNPFGPGVPAAQPQYTQQPVQNPYAQQQVQQPTQQPAPVAAPAASAAVPVATAGSFMRPSAPPPPRTAGNRPPMSALNGRLLLILPEQLERDTPSNFVDEKTGAPKRQDKLHATVIVLDGGQLQWGGGPQAAPTVAQVPHVIKDMWITQYGIISQTADALALRLTGGPGLVLGRLWKTGNAQNDPYVIADPNQQDVDTYNAFVQLGNPFAL